MNREEAERLDRETREYLREMSQELNVDDAFGMEIMKQYLEIIPEVHRKDMIFLGSNSFSLKPGNIKLDLKRLISAGIELAVSVSMPESIFNYIQLALNAFIFAGKVGVRKLDENSAAVVYVLDQMKAYNNFVEEERVIEKVQNIVKEKGKNDILDFPEIINQLLKMQTIRMEDGRISLNEIVWGKI